MNQDEYFKISQEKKLPNRCPILNICQRRALTIHSFSYREEHHPLGNWEDLLRLRNELSEEYDKNKIVMQGESVAYMGGARNLSFINCCPEVPLFDEIHRFLGMKKKACSSFSWDKEIRKGEIEIRDEKHFSECAEFSTFTFKNSLVKKNDRSKKRIRIPQEAKVKAELQKEINSACPFCNNNDVGHFQIHHIDEDSSNNNIRNLILLCPTCHSKITKGDINNHTVRQKKNSLHF